MKTLKGIIAALCAVFMLAACGGGTPESVAESFQKAIMDGDFDAAAKYATKATVPMLEQMAAMVKASPEQAELMNAEYKDATLKVVSSEVGEDKANVTLELTAADGSTDKMDYDLIKEDGSWKVEFKK